MTAVRRSTRSRRPAESIYKDAEREKDRRDSLSSSASSSKKKKKKNEEEEEDNPMSEDEKMIQEEPSSEEDDDETDEEEEERPARKRRSTSRAPKTRNIQVRTGQDPKKRKAGVMTVHEKEAAPSRRAAQTALSSLAKKVLHKEEQPESSLVAALLYSYKDSDKGGKGSKGGRQGKHTFYSAQLEKIARRVVEEHELDPNKCQVDLFNLLFRSVGGSFETNIDPKEIDLENIEDEDWEDLINNILKVMQMTSPDRILLCADPYGAAHAASDKGKASVGAREYRKIYKEFWHTLGEVILSGNVKKRSTVEEDEDDDDSDKEGDDAPETTSRFQVELARDILSRMAEMVGVGLPDIRAAATMAVYQLGVAMLERTVELKSKLTTAERQYNVAKRNKSSRKAEALKVQIDSWKRTVADLEEIVHDTVITIYAKRYRDSNMYIRAESLKTLSLCTLIRPDSFLTSSFLKYFGWMLSDKDAVVREQAVLGLLAPFKEASRSKRKNDAIKIDTSAMSSVIEKFLHRLADCVLDVDLSVQEHAMELLLILVRADFLDNMYDDSVWMQINMRALAPDTTPSVRRDALYFVTDQLESFDSGTAKSDSKVIEQIDALAHWLAHTLADGDIPIENVKYELVDYIVYSLRAMDDHKGLVTNWSAMLRALSRDEGPKSGKGEKEGRYDTVKQRVLLRMLVCAAELKVRTTAADGFITSDADADFLAAQKASQQVIEPTKKKRKTDDSSHEELTLALLRALPDLLSSFKGETSVLQGLTGLPLYFLPSVFDLPNRKKDFTALTSKLSEAFLESTDSTILNNCGHAITSFAKSDHARTGDALLLLKKMTCSLRDRLVELINEKAELSKKADDDDDDDESDNNSSLRDIEHAICLCLRRLRVLSKRWDIADLLGDDANEQTDGEAIDSLCSLVAENLAKELKARAPILPESEEEAVQVPEIWKDGDLQLHELVAETVKESLSFLLTAAAWRLRSVMELVDQGKDDSIGDFKNHVVIRMRDRLVKLATLCFDVHLEKREETDELYSAEHVAFTEAVQTHALSVVGDLRSLFPKQWETAKSPFLRACSQWSDQQNIVVGGSVRFIRSHDDQLRQNEGAEKEDRSLVQMLLLPQARGITGNWKIGNRREAGSLLPHILGSGHEANNLISSMSRAMKKIDSVRLLESHMAGLRGDLEAWIDNEPELENDRPTEEELSMFELAEKQHMEKFAALEHQAARLSASLGVGKLNDKDLSNALVGFVQEGVRFAFSTEEPGYDEVLPLGARLPFLRFVSKYISWIRRDEKHHELVRKLLNLKEAELRSHPDFGELDQFDVASIEIFRRAGNLGKFEDEADAESTLPTRGQFEDEADAESTLPARGEFEDEADVESTLPTRGSDSSSKDMRRRMSVASSISSIRSKNTQSTLSPPPKEASKVMSPPPPSPWSRRKSVGDNSTEGGSTMDSIEEAGKESEESSRNE